MPEKKKYPPIGLDEKLRFGKYGPGGDHKYLWEVIEIDPEYVTWLIEEAGVELYNDAYEAYRERLQRGI